MASKTFLVAAVALVIALVPVSVATQATTWTPPRTADGKPDLQGVWLNQSATPLERPKELAGREFLTDEEVAELKKRAARLFAVGADSDFPGGDNFFLALLANPPDRYVSPTATGSATVMIERTIENRTSLISDPADGRMPPMTPDGQARFARTPPPTAAGGRPASGPEDLSNALRCITYGMPRIGMQNINSAGPMGYYQILQTPHYIAITLEAIHETRIIPLDGRPHLPPHLRQWSGDSRGRWEGDTLVVDTTNFSPKSNFMGSAETLHVVERFKRMANDMLQYEVTVDDLTTWTKSWTVVIRMKRSQDKLYEVRVPRRQRRDDGGHSWGRTRGRTCSRRCRAWTEIGRSLSES